MIRVVYASRREVINMRISSSSFVLLGKLNNIGCTCSAKLFIENSFKYCTYAYAMLLVRRCSASLKDCPRLNPRRHNMATNASLYNITTQVADGASYIYGASIGVNAEAPTLIACR